MTTREKEIERVNILAKRYFPLSTEVKTFVMAHLFAINRYRVESPYGDATCANKFFNDLDKAIETVTNS